MPNTSSAKKKARQDIKKQTNNYSRRQKVKSAVKKIESLIKSKDATNAKKIFPSVEKEIDLAAKNNIFHKKTAARKKSLLAKRIDSIEKK